ncbi:CatB-related O-acetyltransferase [Thermodesulfobacteriota bacterium]
MGRLSSASIDYSDYMSQGDIISGKKVEDLHTESFNGHGVFIAPNSRISCFKFSIGEFSRISGPATIEGTGSCRIGKFCAMGDGVNIITNNSKMNRLSLQNTLHQRHGFSKIRGSKGDVNIKNNVWIGDNVLILSGIEIGDGAVVGSGSVVCENLRPFSMSIGAPARVIRMRFSKSIIRQLMDIRWWDWSEEKISKNKQFFEVDLTQNPDIELKNLIVQ